MGNGPPTCRVPMAHFGGPRRDGSQRLQLTVPPLGAPGPHWSLDGKQIAFSAGRRTRCLGSILSRLRAAVQQGYAQRGREVRRFPLLVVAGRGVPRLWRPHSPAVGQAGFHRLDLKTGTVSTSSPFGGSYSVLTHSPNGRYIAGLAGMKMNLRLYDVAARKQAEVDAQGWS